MLNLLCSRYTPCERGLIDLIYGWTSCLKVQSHQKGLGSVKGHNISELHVTPWGGARMLNKTCYPTYIMHLPGPRLKGKVGQTWKITRDGLNPIYGVTFVLIMFFAAKYNSGGYIFFSHIKIDVINFENLLSPDRQKSGGAVKLAGPYSGTLNHTSHTSYGWGSALY